MITATKTAVIEFVMKVVNRRKGTREANKRYETNFSVIC